MPHADIPEPWRPLLDRLTTDAWRRLLVLGAPDRGKSTFCDVLLRLLHAQGTKAMLLDTALAEKMMGPPACLTLGQIEADSYRLKDLYFVGGIDSSRRVNAIVSGAARLADRAEGRLVIDTCGTFNGPARVLKGLKIDTLQPDIVVALERDDELEPFLAVLSQKHVHRLAPSNKVQERNAMARAFGRLQAFQAVLAGAKLNVLQGLNVEAWDEDAFDWTTDHDDFGSNRSKIMNVIDSFKESERDAGGKPLHTFPHPALSEFICGFADAQGEELGIGILNGVDAASNTCTVTTTAPPDRIRRVRVGMALPEELKI